MENEQITAEIDELEHMNELVQVESKEVAAAKIVNPVRSVEESLSAFVTDAFNVTRKDFEFGQFIQESLIDDLQNDKLNPNQKITLFSSYAVNNNDKISKLLAPIMQLMTARQQAELAAQAAVAAASVTKEKETLKDVSKEAPTDVLQGMKMMNDFFSMFAKINTEQKSE